MPKGINKKIKKKKIKKVKKITLTDDIKRDIEKLKLIDDEFFNACLKDNVKAVTHILRIIFNDENLEIINLKVQEDLTNFQGHSVTLDIIAKNKVTNIVYNIEIQRAKAGASPERARYHVDIYDTHNLKKNRDFRSLPTTYVIFITEKDIFGRGLPIYKIQRYFEDNKEPFNDRSHIYYVNGDYKGNDDIGKLVHDLQCKKPEEFYFEELAEKVRFFKRTKEGKMEISDLLKKTADKYIRANKDKYIAKGEKLGMAKGEKLGMAKGEKLGMANAFLETAKRMLKDGFSIEKIMQMTNLSLADIKAITL